MLFFGYFDSAMKTSILIFSLILNVSNLSHDDLTPYVTIEGTGSHSISISWMISLSASRNGGYYYRVRMKNKFDKTVEREESEYSLTSYKFTNLDSATNYSFQVMACEKYTYECGDWSKVVVGTTKDGIENVTLNCVYDMDSKQGKVYVNWSLPRNPNEKIDNYNIVLRGAGRYIYENGSSESYTFGPALNQVKSDQKSTQFENLKPNTNYTVSVSAVTRSEGSEDPEVRDCFMSLPKDSKFIFNLF